MANPNIVCYKVFEPPLPIKVENPHLVYTHDFYNPSFKMEYLLIPLSHSMLLCKTSVTNHLWYGSLTYIYGCPVHNIGLDGIIYPFHHSVRNSLTVQ